MIEIKHVWKRFGRKTVLEDLSLEVSQGETFAVVGPSGTGKSILLDLLAGLDLPDDGEIKVGNCQLTAQSLSCACKKVQAEIGFMFQDGALLDSLNVFDNIALPLKEKGTFPIRQIQELVSELLEDLDLTEAKERFPHELSGGMIKRVALARAVIHQPKILLVDEPTSGLDPTRAKVTFELIHKLHKKYRTTALIVTHNVKGIYQYIDRVGLLYHGRMAAVEKVNSRSFPSSALLGKFLKGELVHEGS